MAPNIYPGFSLKMTASKTTGKGKMSKEEKKDVVAGEEEKPKKETKAKKETKPKAEKKEKPKAEKKEEKPKKEKKVKAEKKEDKPKKETKAKAEKKTVKKDAKKITKKDAKKTKKTEKKETKPKVEKKITKKVSKKDDSKKDKGVYRQYVSEAIAAIMTEDNRWVSFIKIQDYIYKYIEEANPTLYRSIARKTIEKMIEEKILVQKKNSVRFSSEGEKKYKPEQVPKRKEIRTIEVKEEEEEKPINEVVITQSGRMSQKRF